MISTATRWWVTGDPNAPMLQSVLWMHRGSPASPEGKAKGQILILVLLVED